MKQKITGYLKDLEDCWVGKLSCGHVQHIRHNPPWTVREWVTTAEGRQSRIGIELNCVVCDQLAQRISPLVKKAFLDAYESAGSSGLCDEGRLECAVEALDSAILSSLAQEPDQTPIDI